MNLIRKIHKASIILWRQTAGKVLDASKLHFSRKIDEAWRTRLVNYDFTIIAPNCAAGLIYHRLGLQFLSPTINLWIEEAHYLRFCQNLRHYLDLPLEFIIPSGRWHPIAMCGDVKIYFNHYKTVEEARNKWEERKKRVNWDNLYLIGDDRCLSNETDIKVFLEIPCRNHIVFTSKKLNISGTTHLSSYDGKEHVGYYVMDQNPFTGLRCYEKEFDVVNWLNSDLA